MFNSRTVPSNPDVLGVAPTSPGSTDENHQALHLDHYRDVVGTQIEVKRCPNVSSTLNEWGSTVLSIWGSIFLPLKNFYSDYSVSMCFLVKSRTGEPWWCMSTALLWLHRKSASTHRLLKALRRRFASGCNLNPTHRGDGGAYGPLEKPRNRGFF